MDHDDDVGAGLERQAVTRLLVRPVPAVRVVPLERDARQLPRDLDGTVGARVVDEHDLVDVVLRHDLVVGPAERPAGVVRGHDDGDSLLPVHDVRSCSATPAGGAVEYIPGGARPAPVEWPPP